MKNLFQSNAVETAPQPLQSTSQVTKSMNEILDSCPEVGQFVMVSENENWAYFRALDFDGKLLYKYAIKSKGEFSMDTKYNWSTSKEDPNEFLGYPVRSYEVKGTVLFSRERPAPKPVETPAPQGNMSPELMQQFMAFMQMQSQQQSAPKESDIPF